MNSEFIEQTLRILKYTDLSIHFPEIYDVTMEDDKRHMHGVFEAASGGLRLKDNFVLQAMIFFGLIDAYIDIHNPELEGKNFTDKYKKLSIADDSSIMAREIYRLLRILRNAAIHSRTDISLDEKNIEATTDDSKLHISVSGLEFIYTFVLLLIQESNYSDEYKASLLRTYYDDIWQTIVLLEDKSGNHLADISAGPRLGRVVRYRVKNPVFQVDNDTQSLIIKKYALKASEAAHRDYEYIVNMNNSSYLIPNEVLDETGRIRLEDINKWACRSVGGLP